MKELSGYTTQCIPIHLVSISRKSEVFNLDYSALVTIISDRVDLELNLNTVLDKF